MLQLGDWYGKSIKVSELHAEYNWIQTQVDSLNTYYSQISKWKNPSAHTITWILSIKQLCIPISDKHSSKEQN
jgi:prefoldin subunit 5